MNLLERRQQFEASRTIYESVMLTFHGVEGYDVYNSSIPFYWNGKRYIYGRVEKREEWARSWVRLFQETAKDEWTLVEGSMLYQLEDPFISHIGGVFVLGGTHVRVKQSQIDTYYDYFYRGTDLNNLYYFATGPEDMKDIRLIELPDSRIGVFSRPRSEEIRRQYGSESLVGFTVVNSLDDLNGEVIQNAPYIPGLFAKDEWGGCNQALSLDSGKIGIIGHLCYKAPQGNEELLTYMNFSFVLDPATHEALDIRIIGTRSCYPEGPAKKPNLTDCCFTTGIVMREDGRADLYSGIGDTEVGRIVIDYPFEGWGRIVSQG